MKTVLFLLVNFISAVSYSQIISQNFSSTVPTGWLTTGTYLCVMNFDGTATGNFRNVVDGTKRSVRFPSASNGGNTFLYIPINFVSGSDYNITFYTKRACSVTLNTNETANQTTLLTTQTLTNSSCASNWSNWYEWNFIVNSTYTGFGYIQINFPTIYGGPASAYLDDVGVYEISPLPISLLDFKGYNEGRNNIIEWSTSSEKNNDYFTLEKTIDGNFYELVGTIEGAGNSIYYNSYLLIDNNVNSNINYYRLKQTDFDGNSVYSNLISIDNRMGDQNNKAILMITNILGQEVDFKYKGVLVLIYKDGSVRKMFNQ
jgi:hypothetical protein